jgi:V/A-type H+/Na+-transporting ATPase subunit I
MPWPEALEPVRMERVALVAPRESLREVLVEVADAGTVEIDVVTPLAEGEPGEAARRLQRVHAVESPRPCLAPARPDLAALERDGRADLLAGEAELEGYARDAQLRGSVAALTGWAPSGEVPHLSDRLAAFGGAIVPLPRPRGTDPPTLLRPDGRLHRSFAPLVNTYATVPYADVDPTLLAGLAYIVMFGMMFADAGHGLLLLLGGLLLRVGWPHRLAKLRPVWLFIAGAGVSACVFGLLFGEFFGPTGVVPTLWLSPLDEPVTLLVAALGVGAVLLAAAYALGTINRWREGGWRLALVAPSGIAGAALFLGLGLLALGMVSGREPLVGAGVLVAIGGMALAYVGLLAAAGGGSEGVAQATVELFDSVIRLGTNLVSFARLAAFGLTHAALGAIVWAGTTTLWVEGGLAALGAIVLFVVGNAVSFTLEAVVAGVQALRLEYYELFSRVFQDEGRRFRPWHIPTASLPVEERVS